MIVKLVLSVILTQTVLSKTLPKCCPISEHLSNTGCTESYHLPPWGHHYLNGFTFKEYNLKESCPESDWILLTPQEYRISQNGQIYVTDENSIEQEINEKFCIDYMILKDFGQGVSIAFCSPEYPDDYVVIPTAYSIGLIISIPFLIATLFIFITLKPLRTVDGYVLIAQVFSMLLGYINLLTVNHLTSELSQTACIYMGFAVQFFFLATFFWLNVMCIDIYWAFSGFKIRGSASERNRKKLLAYSIYAWGMPLIILAVTVAVDYWDFIPPTSHFKPNIGKDRCFFKGRLATWTYFYGPMALILFSNLILFAITAYRIWRQRRENAVFQNGDSRRHDRNESERFNLYLKLFLVMGINWISELVSFMFGKEVPQYLWYITDITNTLQGVFIFLIFVWKKRVRKLLWEKLKKKESRKGGSTTTCVEDIN